MIFRLLFALFLTNLLTAAEWKLVWSDEFEGEGHPDPAKWGYESGFIRNQEKQFYTTKRLKNARLEKGHLVIEGHKETLPEKPKVNYTSASLRTKGLASWTFGKIEVRAKLPKGQGVWPAIWTLGENIDQVGWPRCGEIDIMEYVGKEPNNLHGNVHFRNEGRHVSDHKIKTIPNLWEDFHTYAIEWDKERIHFLFEGRRFHSFRVAKADTAAGNPFRKPHYLLLNLALGGNWGGKIDDTIFPARYLIDYVRVYEKKG